MGQLFDNLESTVLFEIYIKRTSLNHVFPFRILSLYVCLRVNTCCPHTCLYLHLFENMFGF